MQIWLPGISKLLLMGDFEDGDSKWGNIGPAFLEAFQETQFLYPVSFM